MISDEYRMGSSLTVRLLCSVLWPSAVKSPPTLVCPLMSVLLDVTDVVPGGCAKYHMSYT